MYRAHCLSVATLISLTALSACEPGIPMGIWDEGVVLEEAPQKEGDVEEGYRALTHEAYISCGIPLTFFEMFGGGFGPVNGRRPNREGANADCMWNASTTDEGVELVLKIASRVMPLSSTVNL